MQEWLYRRLLEVQGIAAAATEARVQTIFWEAEPLSATPVALSISARKLLVPSGYGFNIVRANAQPRDCLRRKYHRTLALHPKPQNRI
jgi:hypothetical protein